MSPNLLQFQQFHTRSSSRRFIKVCNSLSQEKRVVVNDMGFGGLLQLGCTSLHHPLCSFLIHCCNIGYRRLDIAPHVQLPLRSDDVGSIFGLRNEGRTLELGGARSDIPFGTILQLEEKLVSMPICEEFRRSFTFYCCATVLCPTSRLHGCRNLWHTIHADDFRNDVNWCKFVVDGVIDGVRAFQRQDTSWVQGCLLFLQVIVCNSFSHFTYLLFVIHGLP